MALPGCTLVEMVDVLNRYARGRTGIRMMLVRASVVVIQSESSRLFMLFLLPTWWLAIHYPKSHVSNPHRDHLRVLLFLSPHSSPKYVRVSNLQPPACNQRLLDQTMIVSTSVIRIVKAKDPLFYVAER